MDYTIISATWNEHHKQLTDVRRKVFIEEQQVPEELEWDEFDDTAYHVLALDSNNLPIATGRIKKDGQIGRMAVLKHWRNQGLGKTILRKLLDFAAQSGYTQCYLHAQITAIHFYQKYGFTITGAEFEDAGIIHRIMHHKKPD